MGSREREMGRYEMLWDCPSCGTDKLLGLTHRHCPSCGSPQDPTRRYFPPEGEEVAVEHHPYQGADVVCPACDTPNASRAGFCVGCGSPLEGAKQVGTRREQVSDGGFARDSATDAAREAEEARQRARAAEHERQAAASGAARPAKRGGGAKIVGVLGCLGLLGALVAAVAVFLLWKKEAAFVVTGHEWERTIAVETFAPARDSAWRDAVPAGAYELSCSREVRETRKVPDGETCRGKRQDKGDGTFAVVQECTPKYRDEPVYGDRCSYKIDRWQVTSTERAAGVGLAPAPSWPTVALTRPGTCLGCQREGARKQRYTVLLADDGSKEARRCELAEERWRAMGVGSRWVGEVGVLSGAVDCDALARAD